jgi:hypothetical protein
MTFPCLAAIFAKERNIGDFRTGLKSLNLQAKISDPFFKKLSLLQVSNVTVPTNKEVQTVNLHPIHLQSVNQMSPATTFYTLHQLRPTFVLANLNHIEQGPHS